MPQSYREQSKRLLTDLVGKEHVQIDDKKNEVLIRSKCYNSIDLIYDTSCWGGASQAPPSPPRA